MAANQTVEGVDFFLPGGVNERVLPELVPKEDFAVLQGWVPRQIGELITAPGKTLLTRVLQGQTILSFAPFGDYILIQTNTNILRFSNFELFGGIDFTNNLTPDVYPVTASEEETMSQIILKYGLAAGTDGAALTANTWIQVPFNTRIRDTGGNCVLAAGAFTLSAGAYPKNCRIKAWGTVRGMDSGTLATANARLGLMIPAVSTTVPIITGNNVRLPVASAAGRAWGMSEIEDFFVLAAATTYDLRMFVDKGNCKLGDNINAGGLEEKYGMCEILIE